MIFEVTPDHIERLSDEDLRTLVGRLAEQEAVRAGHSTAGVTYGGHQDASDGGVDVRVDLGAVPIKGYIPRSQTGYQVKAESMPKGAIAREMRPAGIVRPSIVKLGEVGGSYIIVSSKDSVTDKALSQRRNAMANAISDEPTASELHLDFYDRRKIASWVNQHPGLIPWVRGRVGLPLAGWRPYEDWSSSPGDTTEQYLVDNHVRIVSGHLKDGVSAIQGIEAIRETVGRSNGAVRLVGLSGVGKTRLVQALFDKNVGSNPINPALAVYTDVADTPVPTPLELLGHLMHLGRRCVLIVDNCGAELHRKLCARMRNAESAVSIITVEYDIQDDELENTDTYKLEPASRETLEKIVARRYPKLSPPEVRAIAAFSEGNSRIALALAETARYGESLANLHDTALIKRLFHQNNREDPALLRAAKACSLVYSFDGETLAGKGSELSCLAALAGQSVDELYGHVAELVRRQLVQKRSKWRALLPQALAHKLAKGALQDFPRDRVRAHLVEAAPDRLLKSFSRRLGSLHDSPEAQAVVADWLSQGGLLARVEDLDDVGITVFENIAPVNPRAIMHAIKSPVSAGKIDSNRQRHLRTFVSILRFLAYDPEDFDEAATLISALIEREPDSNSAKATEDVFKSLFHVYLSGTHASAKQRANYLRTIAASGIPSRTSLVLAGLDAMLECSYFTSTHGFEFGARKRDFGLHPKSRDEWWTWYREAFALAEDLVKYNHLRVPVRKMVASQFRLLADEVRLTDELVMLGDRFAADGGWPEGWVGVKAACAILRKKGHKVDAEKLEALQGRLRPETLEARIASYVLPDEWGALDVAEMDIGDEKRFEKARKKAESVCQGIGGEIAADLDLLKRHLPTILTSASTRVAIVAKAVGRETTEARSTWELILAALLSLPSDARRFVFPAAFLSGLADTNKALCEQLLDESLANVSLHPAFVIFQSAVGVDRAGSARLVKAAKSEGVPVRAFWTLGGGRSCDSLSGDDLKDLLTAIAARSGGLAVALDILQMRFFSKSTDKLPIEAGEKDAARLLLGMLTFEERSRDDARTLSELVRKGLNFPADAALADQLCARLLAGVSRSQVYASDYGELIAELSARFPRSVLNILVESGSIVFDGRRSIFGGFRENRPCPLRRIPDEILLQWARERPETRFVQLAEVIRPWRSINVPLTDPAADDEDGGAIQWTPVALGILHEAPDPLAVLNEYVEHFHPGGWSGSLASILASRVPLLEELTKEPDARIAGAATDALASLNQSIERTREWEMQDSRERDERFEW